MQTGESREIYHFHYTAWPDFGVPESPAAFLKFLLKVRESGSLGPEHGPSVVHCSAGIGRSGTFSLVDTCLVLVRITRAIIQCKVCRHKDRSFAKHSYTVEDKAYLARLIKYFGMPMIDWILICKVVFALVDNSNRALLSDEANGSCLREMSSFTIFTTAFQRSLGI